MPSPLRLLILEDRSADAELMLHELRRAGLAVDWQRVETEADFVAALNPGLDLILADYSLPQFSGLRALQLLQERQLDIPFIVVTGSINEEVAVECIKQGAADYLLKDRLTRLGQAVTHALEQRRLRVANQWAAESLRESEARFRVIFEHANDAIHVSNAADEILEVNSRMCELMGYSREELLKLHVSDLQAPEKRGSVGSVIANELARFGSTMFEGLNLHHSGRTIPVEISVARMEFAQGNLFVSIIRDITERKQAEQAVRASEQKYRRLHESMIDGFVYVDMEGHILDSNPSFQQMLGYSAEELTRLTYRDLTPDKWHAAERAIVDEQILPRGYSDIYQKEYRRKDGTIFPIEIHTFLIKNDAGENEGMWAIVRDITERQRAEAALVQERLLLRTVIDNLPDAVYAKDRQGRKILVNRADLDNIGKPESAVLGKTDVEIFPPHIAAQFEADDQSVLQTGQAVLNREELVINEQGRQLWQRTSKLPLTDAAGRIVGLVGIGHDITARKQAEEALRESEKRFRALIENSADVIALLTGEGIILYESPAVSRVLGYQPVEMVGHNAFEFLHPDDYAVSQESYGKLFQQPQMPTTNEIRYKRKDSTWCWVRATGTNLLTEPGVKAIVINYHDITESKRAEEAIHESERRERERATELQTIMDTVPAAVWIAHDQMSQVITGNRAAYELLHLPPGSNASRMVLEGQPLTHTRIYQNGVELPPNDLPLPLSAATGVEIRDFEEEIVFDDGTVVYELGNVMPLFDEQGYPRGAVGAFIDITERKQAEQEHLTHLRFFENMDKVNRAIQGTPDLEQMMSDVLETVLSIFECDRSWLLYPCDPDAPSFRVPMEITRPEYSGAKILNVDMPMSPGEARNMREALESDVPVTYVAGTDRPISTAQQFGVQSQMFVPIYPKLGKPWVFGMHQCSYPRVWTQEERKLFQEIGRRLTDGLTSLLAYRDLRESEAILKEAQRVGRLGSWDWDAQADIIAWSEEYYRIYGFDPQQRPPGYVEHLKAYTPESATRLDAAVKINLQTGEPYELDLELARPDGSSRWITARSETRRDKNGRIVGLRGTAQDITERKRMESLLRDQVATLQTLTEIDREIIAATEPEGVLDLVCRRATDLAHVPKSVISTLSLANDEMTMAASHGLRDPKRLSEELARVWRSGSMHREILSTHETIWLNDTLTMGVARLEVGLSEDIRALVLVPLIAGEKVLGVLGVFDITPHAWTADELQMLGLLAGQAAIALEKLQLLQTVQNRALHLATLNEIGPAITSSLDLDRVLVTLLDKVRQAALAEASSVALIDKSSGDLVFRQAIGGAAHIVMGMRLSPGEGVAGWVAQHRQSVRVDDAATDTRVHALQNTAGPGGTRFVTHNLVCVPLIVRDTVTGVLELVNSQRGKFGQDDVQLLESVAAQAAIVIENVRLFETEHTAREWLETLYRIGKAINSTLEADTILDRLTDEAVQATQATHGSALVARPEQGCFERRSLRGYSPEQAEAARADWLPLDSGVNGRAYHLRQIVYVNDVQVDPDYHRLIPTTRSEIAVPIVRGGQVIGNLDLQSPITDAFHDIDVQFLQALTDQVAIALENARLFEETHRQMEELSIVSQVALVGAAGRPFDETVARATDALSRLWPAASLGFLFVDETGQALRMHSSYFNPSPDLDPPISIALEQGLTGWAARQQQPIRVGDVTKDVRYVAWTVNTRSKMVAPLIAGKQVIGVVSVETPELDAFSGDDLRLLTTLAGQLAVIFEKARLDAALVEHTVLLEQRVQERTAEIRREQTRIQAILDALGEGVVVTDTQGVIQYVNQAMEQVTGFSAQESLGQNPRLWQSGQTPREVYEAMWSAVLGGQTWRGEIVNRRKDGELYFASLAAAPIPTTNSGEPLAGIVGIQRDITERKQAEEEMQRALDKERELNNLKSNFVSLTSHEFRTPLTTILSSAEMIEHYGARWSAERRQEHLQRIQTAVKYMTGLLNDILVVAKAEADRLEFVPEPLELVKFCRGLVEEFELMDKGNHTLLFNVEVDCAQVNMDEQLLRHILSNLLSNALKYSPPGSGVQFDLACQTGQAVFRIQDHGLGIPFEDQARLFETFHRARNVRNIAGTGLGLTIVKRSVDLHGGTIEIMSQVDRGTTVTVSLPTGTPDNG